MITVFALTLMTLNKGFTCPGWPVGHYRKRFLRLILNRPVLLPVAGERFPAAGRIASEAVDTGLADAPLFLLARFLRLPGIVPSLPVAGGRVLAEGFDGHQAGFGTLILLYLQGGEVLGHLTGNCLPHFAHARQFFGIAELGRHGLGQLVQVGRQARAAQFGQHQGDYPVIGTGCALWAVFFSLGPPAVELG